MSPDCTPAALPALLEAAVLRHPDRVALIDGDTSMSFVSLRGAAITARARLSQAGLRPGDTIAIRLQNSAQHLVALLGAMEMGMTIVPISDRLTEDETRHILTDSGAVALMQEPDAVGAHVPGPYRRITAVPIDHSLLEPGRADGATLDPERAPTSFLPYTSGTTGRPKGVVMPAASRALLVTRLLQHYAIDDEDVLLASLPIAHSAGLTFALAHLVAGGGLVLNSSAFSADDLEATVRRHSITTVLLVPTMLEAVARSGLGSNDLASVRRWVVTGSPLSAQTRSKFADAVPGAAIWQYYGATESPHMTLLRPDEGAHRSGSVGKPFADVQLKVCDDTGKPVAHDEVGEICARSPWMLDAYHHNPTATAHAFRDGWYRTGDLGCFDADGYLYVTGRKREVVISGGLNIYPAEVEAVLRQHPAVADVTVVGAPDNYWGEKVVAVVVRSRAVEPDELVRHCRAHLASYKKPANVVFVTTIPRNHLGKVDQRTLGNLVEAELERQER